MGSYGNYRSRGQQKRRWEKEGRDVVGRGGRWETDGREVGEEKCAKWEKTDPQKKYVNK